MLWFEYYFNLLRFFFFPLYWCVELILPLCCRREMESLMESLRMFSYSQVCKCILIIGDVCGFGRRVQRAETGRIINESQKQCADSNYTLLSDVSCQGQSWPDARDHVLQRNCRSVTQEYAVLMFQTPVKGAQDEFPQRCQITDKKKKKEETAGLLNPHTQMLSAEKAARGRRPFTSHHAFAGRGAKLRSASLTPEGALTQELEF